jgi:hypothetical protein
MPTDDELVNALRNGMRAATDNLNPAPDLAAVVRQRRRSVRGLVASAVVLAVAIAATVSAVLIGGGSGSPTPAAAPGQTTSHHPPGHAPSHTARVVAPRTTPHRSVPVKPASYRLDRQLLRRHHSAALNCPANAKTAPFGKSANPRPGVWFWTNGECFFVAVGGADTKPADATPIHIKGHPGLYSTLKDGMRTIYAPGIGGRGWWVLTMAANTPRKTAVRMIVPTN